ncbi:hypothetical protein [Massilia sp.]|uniref:hypothetical protein n=1 Tax=Massilia sp. TaxID=1882437 RepID=UPI002897088E|nr:hypothetical protein [Massilia sp.]
MTLAATLGMAPTSTLRRAPKATVPAPAFSKPNPYGILMACWVDFMHTNDRDLGSRGMRLEGDADPDVGVHEAQRIADIKTGEAVNAMVDSLSIQHRWAIYRSQGISTAWRFQNANYAEVLEAARNDLEQKLQKNVATRLYFS